MTEANNLKLERSLAEENPCDYCNRRDQEDKINCPNGMVSIPFQIIGSGQGDLEGIYIANCFGYEVVLATEEMEKTITYRTLFPNR